MDFTKYATSEGEIINPFAGKAESGDWLEGTISLGWLQEHFGYCETLDECIANTESEGLKLFFEYLKAQQ